MRIRRLRFKNFQSHKDTEIFLHDGVTGVQGDNDVGKTALLRGLESLIYFTPMTVSTWARLSKEPCRVEGDFELDDGEVVTIARQRTEDEKGVLVPRSQFYEVTRGGKTTPFPSLKQNLPPQVEAIFAMQPIVFEDKTEFSLNLSEQIPDRGPFLIGAGYTGATRVKILGSVTDQHLFDEGGRVHKITKERLEGEAKTLEALKRETESELDLIRGETNYSSLLEEVEGIAKEVERGEGQVLETRRLLDGVARTYERVRDLHARTMAFDGLPELRAAYDDARAKQVRLDHNRSLLRGVAERLRALEGLREKLGRLADVRRLREEHSQLEVLRSRIQLDLPDRFLRAERSLASIQSRIRAGSCSGALSALGELQDLVMRTSDQQGLLCGLEQAQRNAETAAARVATGKQAIAIAKINLADKLKTTKTCPYAPFAVEFQDTCKAKFKV